MSLTSTSVVEGSCNGHQVPRRSWKSVLLKAFCFYKPRLWSENTYHQIRKKGKSFFPSLPLLDGAVNSNVQDVLSELIQCKTKIPNGSCS